MRVAIIQHDGKTWRIESVDVNARVYADDELMFVGFMSDGIIRFYSHPDDVPEDALRALELALAASEEVTR